MKKITHIMAAVALLFAATPVSAKILIGTSSANGEIAIGTANDITIFDINGDGKSDRMAPVFDKTVDRLGKADANKMARYTFTEVFVPALFNPLTGAMTKKMKTGTQRLVVDQDTGSLSGFGVMMEFGGGIFTVGRNRYFTEMGGANSLSNPRAKIKGTKYIDAAISVVIFNAKTGTLVKQFSTRSNGTWELMPYECRFIDIGGTTYFQEKFMKRPTKVAPPTGKKLVVHRDQFLFKIWNATHTRMTKQYIMNQTNIF